MTVNVIDDFFDAHNARLAVDARESLPGLVDPGALEGLFRVTRPGLDGDEVSSALERSVFGTRGTALYRKFLSAASYRALDCDGLVEFAATTSRESWLDDVVRFRGQLDPKLFFAFGFDPVTSAVFCLHRVEAEREPVVSIVDQAQVLAGAFSSFRALLRVVTLVLRSDVVLFVERGFGTTAEQRALVASLRDLDPEGFGRVGWPAWYRRAVGGEDWND